MRPVKIITDSTADLSKELLKEIDVISLPLYVQFPNKTYQDGIDITTNELYELVETHKTLPKTAAISPGDFMKTFDQYIKEGFDVVYIGIGSKISATFQSALVASQEFPEDRIFLIDSLNLSSGIALLVLKAKDLRDQGLSAEAIKEEITKLVPKVRSQFAIRVLDYLHKGGRASGTAALVGKMLRVRPIIKVEDGVLNVYKKPMGSMKKAVDIMLTDFEKTNIDEDYVMITHTMAPNQADYMVDFVQSNKKHNNLIISEAGCVISSHCGAGTIGILYIEK